MRPVREIHLSPREGEGWEGLRMIEATLRLLRTATRDMTEQRA